MEETSWVLALRSSREAQNKLEGALRTKPVLKESQHEMAAAGQERLREQFSIKLKKFDNDTRTESTSSAAIIKFARWNFFMFLFKRYNCEAVQMHQTSFWWSLAKPQL